MVDGIDRSSSTLTHEITLTVDDEQIPVQLEEPGMLTKVRLAQQSPPSIALELGSVPEQTDEFILALVEEVSDFPPELVDDLPEGAFNQLLRGITSVLNGDEPTVDGEARDGISYADDDTLDPFSL